MKTFLISLLVLFVLLISGPTMYHTDRFILIAGLFLIYVPMIIIEAFILRWLFTDFDAEDSIKASILINFVNIVFVILLTLSKFGQALLIHMFVGIVVTNIFIQLLVLRFEYKAVISIRGVIGIVLAHIAIIGVIKWWVLPIPYLF